MNEHQEPQGPVSGSRWEPVDDADRVAPAPLTVGSGAPPSSDPVWTSTGSPSQPPASPRPTMGPSARTRLALGVGALSVLVGGASGFFLSQGGADDAQPTFQQPASQRHDTDRSSDGDGDGDRQGGGVVPPATGSDEDSAGDGDSARDS